MNERNNKLELLGSAPIPKALMALGIPIMIGMLINALYNLVDTVLENFPLYCPKCKHETLITVRSTGIM